MTSVTGHGLVVLQLLTAALGSGLLGLTVPACILALLALIAGYTAPHPRTQQTSQVIRDGWLILAGAVLSLVVGLALILALLKMA